jgi:hypothetical protein
MRLSIYLWRFLALIVLPALWHSPCHAASLVITVAGTISSGADNNVFGFGENAPLAGKSFTLTYTLDTSTGASVAPSCTNTASVFQDFSNDCNSGVMSASGSTLIQIGGATMSYTDYSDISISRDISLVGSHYVQTIGSNDTAVEAQGLATMTAKRLKPDFDWRSAFSDAKIGTIEFYGTSNGSFEIEDGMNSASATLVPASITVSASSPCSVQSVSLTVDNTSVGKQPNILGGNVVGTDSNGIPYGNSLTVPDVSITGGSGFTPVDFGDLQFSQKEDGNPYGNYTGTNEAISVGALPVNGQAVLGYISGYEKGGGATGAFNDQVVATVCGTSSSALNIYEYYPSINSAKTVQFDIGQSQVTDAVFTDTSALNATGIQEFFDHYGTFLADFYFDSHTEEGGWYNPDGTGQTMDTYSSTDDAYCPTVSQCPAVGDTGINAATVLLKAAVAGGVNPELLLTKLQVEKQLIINAATLPSVGRLNAALGCKGSGNQTFLAQLYCAASTYRTRLNDAEKLTFPYFFPQINDDPIQNVQYAYSAPNLTGETCNEEVLMNGCAFVGYYVADASTYSELKYTPFVQTSTEGGGVRLFETLWLQFSQVW